jgi:undecaprenyl diphosphate synthase
MDDGQPNNGNRDCLDTHKVCKTVIDVVRQCPAIGVHTVTLFAFAIANRKRDTDEIDGLWVLFHDFIHMCIDRGTLA